jgi:hypothetical protein
MLRTIRDMLVGVIVAAVAAASVAFATIGTPPFSSGTFANIDQSWLYALSGGTNYVYQYGITAHAGGTQAAAFVLPATVNLIEVDTVATTGDSVALPYASQGTYLMLRNAGVGTLDVYANPGTNGLTASTDTINGASNTSAYTIGNNTNAIFFCAKNGVWNAIKGS